MFLGDSIFDLAFVIHDPVRLSMWQILLVRNTSVALLFAAGWTLIRPALRPSVQTCSPAVTAGRHLVTNTRARLPCST